MQTTPVKNISPWDLLRSHTAARIGLGRAGAGIPTGETLRFKLAHAQARDAVHARLDIDRLEMDLKGSALTIHRLHSQALDRPEYLRRPDLGRRLDVLSQEVLRAIPPGELDLAIVVADGLSALAIQANTSRFLQFFLPLCSQWKVAPLIIVEQARVAIGDEIGQLLGARSVIVLIGERPGLSSPDSLGVYFTFAPRKGLTDERRNCISNIRDAGLSHRAAAEKLAWLLGQAFLRQLSGVELKDEAPGDLSSGLTQG